MYPRQRSLDSGFTLIEVMVVVAIVGLMAWVIVLQLPDSPEDESLEDTAEVFLQQFQHVREQSLLRHWIAGVEFQPNGFRFVRFQNQQWQVINQAPVTPVELPEGMELVFIPGDFRLLENEEALESLTFQDTEGNERQGEQDEEQIQPQVIIFESTEFVPFRVQFTSLHGSSAPINIDGRSGVQLIRDEEAIW